MAFEIETFTEKYSDLQDTNFPVKEDTFSRMSDVTAELLPLAIQYENYLQADDYTSANQLLNDYPELNNCLFSANNWNGTRDAIIAMERFLLNSVADLYENVANSAIGINDNPTAEEASLNAYSAEKVNSLLSAITTDSLDAIPIIFATTASDDMNTFIKQGSHIKFYRTNNLTLNTPYAQGLTGFYAATIFSCASTTTYGFQLAFIHGQRYPAYRYIYKGTIYPWTFGYVKLEGDSTVNGSITATSFIGSLIGTANAAKTATKLQTKRSVQVNLGSTSASSFDATEDITPGVKGVLSAKNGGTGQTSIDDEPIDGSKRMVTSGGVYTALDQKLNKSGGSSNAMSGDLYVEQKEYAAVRLIDNGITTTSTDGITTTHRTATIVNNYGKAAVLEFQNEAGNSDNRRRLALRSSISDYPELESAIVFIEDKRGENDTEVSQIVYRIYGQHNVYPNLSEVTASAAELNILDGVTATTAELNKLDGATVTTTELNYVKGVTSSIQTQLNNKAASEHSQAASTITAGTLAGKVVANASAVSTLSTKQVRNISAGTTEKVALTDALTSGDIYLQYE